MLLGPRCPHWLHGQGKKKKLKLEELCVLMTAVTEVGSWRCLPGSGLGQSFSVMTVALKFQIACGPMTWSLHT